MSGSQYNQQSKRRLCDGQRLDARQSQKGGVVKSLILFAIVVFFLAIAAIGAGGYFAYNEAKRVGPLEKDTTFLLEPGMSVGAIAERLSYLGVLRHPQLFVAVTRVKDVGGVLKAGEYNIPAGVSVVDLVDLLVEGKSILHRFTAAEGLTTGQIIRALNANDVLVGGVSLLPQEGDLLPETYSFTRGQTRDQTLQAMMDAQDNIIEELWSERAVDLPFSTPAEAIILASIVEKETGIAGERPRIAAVFVNRLRKGMRLESDPTIIYGLTKGEPLGRGIRLSELRGETPYNTYVINGLPPTPIANPGRASIEAVLNPATTDDIFFVADGTGGHSFASTLRDHNRNVARWREVERARRSDG